MATAPACRSAASSLGLGLMPTRTMRYLLVRCAASDACAKSSKVHGPIMADLSKTRKSSGAASSMRQTASSGSSGIRAPWVIPGWVTLIASTCAPTGGETMKSAPAACHPATFSGVSGTPPPPQTRSLMSGMASGKAPGAAMTTASADPDAAASAASKSPEHRAISAMAGRRAD